VRRRTRFGRARRSIAHDFNNVLATILGNVELARQDLSASPLALESLEEIRNAGSRARDLVQQILSFSRRQPTERRPDPRRGRARRRRITRRDTCAPRPGLAPWSSRFH
jgi:signal transduction histidine kinase